MILFIVSLIPFILLSIGGGCGADRTSELADELEKKTGQEFDGRANIELHTYGAPNVINNVSHGFKCLADHIFLLVLLGRIGNSHSYSRAHNQTDSHTLGKIYTVHMLFPPFIGISTLLCAQVHNIMKLNEKEMYNAHPWLLTVPRVGIVVFFIITFP